MFPSLLPLHASNHFASTTAYFLDILFPFFNFVSILVGNQRHINLIEASVTVKFLYFSHTIPGVQCDKPLDEYEVTVKVIHASIFIFSLFLLFYRLVFLSLLMWCKYGSIREWNIFLRLTGCSDFFLEARISQRADE